MRIRALLLAMIPLLARAAPAAAQDVATQLWPEVDTFVKLNDRMRFYVPLSSTRNDAGDSERTRVAGGIEFHLWQRVVPEVYVQRDHTIGTNTNVNGFGLVLSLYLR
ncbi:MAG: hypothetical protein ACRD1B_02025 [Thermoanaerobaculia bacterium]